MVYYKNECATLYYLSDEGVALTVWSGKTTNEKYIDVMTASLQLIKEKKIEKWVGQFSENISISKDHITWMDDTWLTDAIRLGLRYAAISSTKKHSTTQLKFVNRKEKIKFFSQHFENLEAALAWLQTVN